jgi:hypothetical protein
MYDIEYSKSEQINSPAFGHKESYTHGGSNENLEVEYPPVKNRVWDVPRSVVIEFFHIATLAMPAETGVPLGTNIHPARSAEKYISTTYCTNYVTYWFDFNEGLF